MLLMSDRKRSDYYTDGSLHKMNKGVTVWKL